MNLISLKELFTNLDDNLTEHFKELLISNEENSLIFFPGLPELLLTHSKFNSLNIYLDFLSKKDKSYLIINFFQNHLLEINEPKILEYAKPFVDNIYAISLDKCKINDCFKIYELFPDSIDEQTIVKLIKIYETNQKHFFDIDGYDKFESIIIQKITKMTNLNLLEKDINDFISIIPLYIKICNSTDNINFLKEIDKIFKKNFPSYMDYFIDKLILEKKLDSSLSQKKLSQKKLKI